MLSEEVVEISLRSLFVSSTATFMALAWSVPTAYRLSASYSRLSRIIIGICNALVSLPTVIVGLFLYMLFSRTGPLGIINLLYTPYAIILGESILITPLLISLFHDVFRDYRGKYWEMALSLGATSRQAATLVIREALPRLVTASLIGFARAISELGVALMVGGNIRGYTRVLTTSI
ncbi:MAG TPA: ABC transporter permease subunit, partial [Acidilobales archaeon]|nr:ABC transporter permease subunit [Acidilobales archaeon]